MASNDPQPSTSQTTSAKKLSPEARPIHKLLVIIAENARYEHLLGIASDVGMKEAKLGFIRQDFKDNAFMQIAKVSSMQNIHILSRHTSMEGYSILDHRGGAWKT